MFIPKQVAAVTAIADKKPSRYSMNGVHLRRVDGKAQAVATDGRRAIVLEWDEPEAKEFPPIDGLSAKQAKDFSVIVSTDAIRDICKAIPKAPTRPGLEYALLCETSANGTVQIGTTDLERQSQLKALVEEGEFPPIDSEFPRGAVVYSEGEHGKQEFTHVRISVNPKLLAELLKAVSVAACSDWQPGVELTIPISGNRAIMLRASEPEGRRAQAVCMPINGHVVEATAEPKPKK